VEKFEIKEYERREWFGNKTERKRITEATLSLHPSIRVVVLSAVFVLGLVVGLAGFEPATPRSLSS
jgi:hypothetical protein